MCCPVLDHLEGEEIQTYIWIIFLQQSLRKLALYTSSKISPILLAISSKLIRRGTQNWCGFDDNLIVEAMCFFHCTISSCFETENISWALNSDNMAAEKQFICQFIEFRYSDTDVCPLASSWWMSTVFFANCSRFFLQMVAELAQ